MDFGAPMKISDDPLADEKIKQLLETLSILKEAKALEKEVKDMLKAEAEQTGQDNFSMLTPDCHIEGKKDSRGAWKFTFKNVGGQ
ncbi:MAG TPA: hypothetical protein VM123_00600 [archaeon]|nr:hypothetical protein [archaeon]